MGYKGYNSYRGRTSKGKIALVVVLILLLLLSGGYLILQDHIIYESDGSISLDFPFLNREDPPADNGGEKLPVEILPGDDEEEQTPETVPVLAKELSAADLSASALGQLANEGYNGVVVEMKGFNGTFYYTSQYAANKALAEQAVSQSAVQEILSRTNVLTAAARVGCFHDSFHAFADMTGAGICQQGGYIWYDDLSSHWMDPAKEGTRTYMAQVLRECVDMGFDEIILTDFAYPTRGNLSQIDYSGLTVTKSQALADFLTAMREELGDAAALSVELSQEQILGGADQVSGVDPAAVLPLVDRVYVTGLTDRQAVENAVAEAVGEGNLPALVEVTQQGDTRVYQQ